MSKSTRQFRRRDRRSDRKERRELNKKLRDKDYGWLERRRKIRARRKYQRAQRRVAVNKRRMREIDRGTESLRETQGGGRGRGRGRDAKPLAPIPPPPPPVQDDGDWRPGRAGFRPPGGRPLPVRRPPLPLQASRPWEADLDEGYYDNGGYYDEGGSPSDPFDVVTLDDGTVLVDPDGTDLLQGEYAENVYELANELAGEIAAEAGPSFAGYFDADRWEASVDEKAKYLYNAFITAAYQDGWDPYELDTELAIVEAASNLLSGTGRALVSGQPRFEVGALGVLTAIPAMAALAAPVLAARAKANERQDARRERRQGRIEEKREQLAEYGPRAGILQEDGEWGPRAEAGNVSVRARFGHRAGLVDLGRGYYMVRDISPDEPVERVQGQLQAAANAAMAAIDQALASPIAGCCAACDGRRWGR